MRGRPTERERERERERKRESFWLFGIYREGDRIDRKDHNSDWEEECGRD